MSRQQQQPFDYADRHGAITLRCQAFVPSDETPWRFKAHAETFERDDTLLPLSEYLNVVRSERIVLRLTADPTTAPGSMRPQVGVGPGLGFYG